MKLSSLFAPTLKEEPKDAEVASHKLLLRAGYIRKLAAGIYDFLPLGIRTLRRVEAIVRDEMDRAGAQEVLMPAVQPAEIWKQSGRWEYYGSELLRFKDRKGAEFCLGPTHEEVITDLVRGEIRSYRQLPVNLYQIQSKFRDEARPRAGLMRGREFVMKDAYSFDVDEAAARKSYEVMYNAYCRIFDRIGLKYRPVEADTGNIGGNLSHEFQVLADSGEDAIVSCPSCGYTANVEKAELQIVTRDLVVVDGSPEEIHTPNVGHVADVARFLGVDESKIMKTMIFLVDDKPVAVVIRGDLAVNEVKVKVALGGTTIVLANDATVAEITGTPAGYVGPVGLPSTVRVLADFSVAAMTDAVSGANRRDYHLRNVCIGRDVPGVTLVDVRLATGGDACGRCGGTFEFFKGIEVGQVFYLGTKYSAPMGATYLNEQGEEKAMVMGCYGIGVSRVMSAAVEQNHDADGIIWPMSIAPFQVIVLPLHAKDATVLETAEALYHALKAAGIDALYDDRDQRPGFKFKDADLLGIPLRVAVGGRSLADGVVEVKHRRSSTPEMVPVAEAAATIVAMVKKELAGGRDA